MANDKIELDGVVVEHNRNQWTVELRNGHEVRCHLKGKMRKFHIRVVVGDWVRVELDSYNLERGMISYRYQQEPVPEDESSEEGDGEEATS